MRDIISVTLLKCSGMCLVVTLKEKGFIIIDGGDSGQDDEYYKTNNEQLMKFLKLRSNGNKPKIHGWFFTHFHYDHVSFAAKFLQNHTDDIDVMGFYVNSHGDVGDERDLEMKECLTKAISAYPNAIVRYLKTGEEIKFPHCSVDILLSEADLSPMGRGNQNYISAAFNIIFDTGHTATVLGDCDEAKLLRLIDSEDELFCSDEKLKCDVLQCAHHGLPLGNEKHITESVKFYKKLNPSVCLFAQGDTRMANDERFRESKWAGNYYLLHSGASIYSHSKTVTVNMIDLSVVVEE